MQCTNIFFQCTTYIYSVHKCISECTNLFLSAQINFSVHKCISECSNVFLSAQINFSGHKCISQCTNIFLSAQMYFSVHVKSHCTKVASMKSVICQCTCRVFSVSSYRSVTFQFRFFLVLAAIFAVLELFKTRFCYSGGKGTVKCLGFRCLGHCYSGVSTIQHVMCQYCHQYCLN